MRLLIRFFLSGLVITSPALHAQDLSLHFSANSLTYSEASAIYQMLNNRWEDAPLQEGRKAFTRNRLLIGVKERWLSLEYLERNDWLFEFTPDTAWLLYQQENDLPLPDGQYYDVDLRVKHLAARGARFGFHLPSWKNWQLTTYISLLEGKSLQEGRLNGQVTQINGKNYEGHGQLDYRYHEDLLLEHPIERPEGQGLALDFELNWHYQNLRARLLIEDAWMQMQWQNAGFTHGALDTQTIQQNESHFIRYRPLFRGRRGTDDFHQNRLPVMVRLDTDYTIQNWRLQLGGFFYQDMLFPRTSIRWSPTDSLQAFSLGYEFNSNKLLLGYQLQAPGGSHLALTLGSDDARLKFAHALELDLSATYYF